MPIEAVKIPQNVYVEDCIIGPVTLKQLMITGIGTGIGYMFYALAIKAGVRSIPILVVCWTPTLIAAAFSFLKINDLTLLNLILLMIEHMNKPSQRYWSPHPGLSINLITRQATKELDSANTKIADNANRLIDITRQLEKRQEEMNHLAAHNNPNPDALEPVKTQLATAEHRVNPGHIQSEGLDPARSIDSIAVNIVTPSRLTTQAS